MSEAAIDARIRWMIRRDLPAVVEIEKAVFSIPWTAENFIQALGRDKCIGMVAEVEGRPAGFMVYEMGENFLRVDSVAVDFPYQRAGLGAALITKAKNAAKRLKRRGVSCLVRESNLSAQLFFRAAGFRCIGIEDSAYPEYNSEAGYRFRWLVGG